jgi:hypothetical protein
MLDCCYVHDQALHSSTCGPHGHSPDYQAANYHLSPSTQRPSSHGARRGLQGELVRWRRRLDALDHTLREVHRNPQFYWFQRRARHITAAAAYDVDSADATAAATAAVLSTEMKNAMLRECIAAAEADERAEEQAVRVVAFEGSRWGVLARQLHNEVDDLPRRTASSTADSTASTGSLDAL